MFRKKTKNNEEETKVNELKYELSKLKTEIEFLKTKEKKWVEAEDALVLLVKELPKATLEKYVQSYLNRSFIGCPAYIREMFLLLYGFKANEKEVYYINKTKKEPVQVVIGIFENTLSSMIDNYILDLHRKGKLILSCPNCQSTFSLVCTTEENYIIYCKGCGKKLALTVKSNEVTISVKSKREK